MTKLLTTLFSLGIFWTLCFSIAYAQEANDFEAELRLLESKEEAQLMRVEVLTKQNEDQLTDSVSVGNAAPIREATREAIGEEAELETSINTVSIQKQKTRRVRSR